MAFYAFAKNAAAGDMHRRALRRSKELLLQIAVAVAIICSSVCLPTVKWAHVILGGRFMARNDRVKGIISLALREGNKPFDPTE